MLHSVKITINDFYVNSADDWIVTFVSKGKICYSDNDKDEINGDEVFSRTLRKVCNVHHKDARNVNVHQEMPWYW